MHTHHTISINFIFEVFCECPGVLMARAHVYSNYRQSYPFYLKVVEVE